MCAILESIMQEARAFSSLLSSKSFSLRGLVKILVNCIWVLTWSTKISPLLRVVSQKVVLDVYVLGAVVINMVITIWIALSLSYRRKTLLRL
jgi:hypothetical protein